MHVVSSLASSLLISSIYITAVSSYGVLLHGQEADLKVRGRWPAPPLTVGDDDGLVLPESFSWRSVPGIGTLLTAGGNQHIPKYCGACYAFGALHTLQDRVKIARAFSVDTQVAAPQPDYLVAVQTLINCREKGCSGGTVAQAWEWVRDFEGGGIPTDQCMRYEATDRDDIQGVMMDHETCGAVNVCRNCMGTASWSDDNPDYHCFGIPHNEPLTVQCFGSDSYCRVNPYPRVGVADFGELPMDPEAIKQEVGLRGPVACAVDAFTMLNVDGATTLEDSPDLGFGEAGRAAHGARINDRNLTDHIIEVVGWGVDDEGVDFWEIRNSWGDYWADGGFARVRRGRNDMLIESNCMWVQPSGWGVPSESESSSGWQTYDPRTLEPTVAALLESIAAVEIGTTAADPAMEGSDATPGGSTSSVFGAGAGFVGLALFIAAAYFARRHAMHSKGNMDPAAEWDEVELSKGTYQQAAAAL